MRSVKLLVSSVCAHHIFSDLQGKIGAFKFILAGIVPRSVSNRAGITSRFLENDDVATSPFNSYA